MANASLQKLETKTFTKQLIVVSVLFVGFGLALFFLPFTFVTKSYITYALLGIGVMIFIPAIIWICTEQTKRHNVIVASDHREHHGGHPAAWTNETHYVRLTGSPETGSSSNINYDHLVTYAPPSDYPPNSQHQYGQPHEGISSTQPPSYAEATKSTFTD